MNEIETTKKHMEALRALSDVTLKISEARNTLTSLEQNKEKFLEARAFDEVARLTQVLAESQQLIDSINANYGEITELATIVRETAASLVSIHDAFFGYVQTFEKYQQERSEQLGRQRDDIHAAAQAVKVDRAKLKNEQISIEGVKRSLEDRERKLKIDREALDRAVKRLKEGKI